MHEIQTRKGVFYLDDDSENLTPKEARRKSII